MGHPSVAPVPPPPGLTGPEMEQWEREALERWDQQHQKQQGQESSAGGKKVMLAFLIALVLGAAFYALNYSTPVASSNKIGEVSGIAK